MYGLSAAASVFAVVQLAQSISEYLLIGARLMIWAGSRVLNMTHSSSLGIKELAKYDVMTQ